MYIGCVLIAYCRMVILLADCVLRVLLVLPWENISYLIKMQLLNVLLNICPMDSSEAIEKC